jgi:hypothetical protein
MILFVLYDALCGQRIGLIQSPGTRKTSAFAGRGKFTYKEALQLKNQTWNIRRFNLCSARW